MSYTDGLDKPSEYFETKLYTGTGATNAITGVGFAPDFVWCKNRQSALYHGLYDVVRGTGTTKGLSSNSDEAEGTNANFINLTSFDSDGFTLGATVSTNQINTSGENHVAWNWKANGAGVSNTQGSIASTVSANTTSGFSIVSYTGTGANADVGHGLGSAPKMIIFKNRNTVTDWDVYIEPVGAGKRLYLNSDVGEQVATNYMNNTAPTSTLFSVGVADNTNKSGSPQIAYCFAEKKGFSKFGSYTGNGSTDGTFVYTGFKPAFVMVKRTDTSGDWPMVDSGRDTYNVAEDGVYANQSISESGFGSPTPLYDFNSNGFKIRNTFSNINASGGTYIYMAFAENPFVTSTSIPTTAR
jgi:hypothetical protein